MNIFRLSFDEGLVHAEPALPTSRLPRSDTGTPFVPWLRVLPPPVPEEIEALYCGPAGLGAGPDWEHWAFCAVGLAGLATIVLAFVQAWLG